MINSIDDGLTLWINSWAGHSQLADFLVVWVSAVGVPILVFAVACQWWTSQDRLHTRHILLAAGFSFLLGLAVNQLILLFIQRIRPYEVGMTHLLIPPTSDPSFPSDHATASFAIAAAFLLHRFRGAGIFLVAAILVSLTRIYIGIHYVTDILGGALTGISAAGLVWGMFREGTRIDRFLTKLF